MAKPPTLEEAVERATRVQADRIQAVRVLVQARQNITDLQESAERQRAELETRITQQLAEGERADMRAYNAATAAGWSLDELRKIGLGEPQKKARARRRTIPRKATVTPTPAVGPTPTE